MIFFAHDSIVSHDHDPVLEHVIDVDVPDGALAHRVPLIRYLPREQPLDVVVDLLRLFVEERDEVGVEFFALVTIECDQIHHMRQS